jgi:hypothetical protein
VKVGGRKWGERKLESYDGTVFNQDNQAIGPYTITGEGNLYGIKVGLNEGLGQCRIRSVRYAVSKFGFRSRMAQQFADGDYMDYFFNGVNKESFEYDGLVPITWSKGYKRCINNTSYNPVQHWADGYLSGGLIGPYEPVRVWKKCFKKYLYVVLKLRVCCDNEPEY